MILATIISSSFLYSLNLNSFSLNPICITDKIGRKIIGDLEFNFEEVDCDFIAKDLDIYVYVRKATGWGHLIRHRIFKYDPFDDNPPDIFIIKNRIYISIPRVMAVECMSKSWKNMIISYNIKKDYELKSTFSPCKD